MVDYDEIDFRRACLASARKEHGKASPEAKAAYAAFAKVFGTQFVRPEDRSPRLKAALAAFNR